MCVCEGKSVCVRVCVCVCESLCASVCEREKSDGRGERETESENGKVIVCGGVSEREREKHCEVEIVR